MTTTENKTTAPVMVENATLLFRNFAGRERTFNSEGDRNFSLMLPPETAKDLLKEGWRVKQLKPREGEDEGDYHLKVNVNYGKGRPPRCVMITSRGRVDLGSDEVEILDWADIRKVDVIVNGYWSDMAGGGFGGYLKSIFVTINEDELELKYADVQDAGELNKTEDDPEEED